MLKIDGMKRVRAKRLESRLKERRHNRVILIGGIYCVGVAASSNVITCLIR